MANIQKKGENHSFLTTNFVLLQKLNRNAVKYMKVYIIIPCYNEEAVIEETALQLTAVLDEMISNGQICAESRIVFVNDGSKDNTWSIIQRIFETNQYVCGINLANNSGHQNTLMAGLTATKEQADAFITIDADLQDDIHIIPQMVSFFSQGIDIVFGVRKQRESDTFLKRNTALMFYRLMNFLGAKTIYNHADFRLMSKRAVKQLLSYRERNLFLRGIVPLIGYKTEKIYFDRNKRFAGESKYPFFKMLNFAIDGITSFSIKPVRMVFALGVIFILISFLILIWVLMAYFTKKAVPGWASLMLSLWLVGGCVLVGLGIVGEYVGKIYTEVKDRPRFNIESSLIK